MATEFESKSLSDLEREAEGTRAGLIHTVDELHRRVSPQVIKDEVRAYARETGENLLQNLERRARERPLQTVAIAAGLAYPVYRFLINIPAPILLVGAGFALSQTGASTRPRSFERRTDNRDENGAKLADKLKGVAQEVSSRVSEAVSSLKEKAASATDQARTAVISKTGEFADRTTTALSDATTSALEAASDRSAAVRETVSEVYQSGVELAGEKADQFAATVMQSRDTLVETIENHPLIVGGIGLLIGAAIASALPVTRTENRLFGEASDELKDRARGLAADGVESAKTVAQKIYSESLSEAHEHGLGADGIRQTVRDAVGKVKEAVQQAGEALETSGSRVPDSTPPRP